MVRADDKEAELLLGGPVTVARAESLLSRGPKMVAAGNLFVWRDGHVEVPMSDEKVVDPTGGDDALVVALTAALLRGDDPLSAAVQAMAASGATVGHPGGRPDLNVPTLQSRAAELRKQLA